jgi:glucose/arabinose dehydrogenase
MVEVSFEPLLIGIDAVSSIKFAGCPSLMYVATKAGQIFEVTINNATSAVRSSSSSISLSHQPQHCLPRSDVRCVQVEQVRLILDLSSEIVTPSSQAGAAGAGASASSSSSAGSNSTSGSASASSNAADQPGLLGMAFPPDFADTGLFYLYFSARSSAGGAGGAGAAGAAGGASGTAGGADGAVCGDESSMLDHVNRLAEYRLDSTSGIAKYVCHKTFVASKPLSH